MVTGRYPSKTVSLVMVPPYFPPGNPPRIPFGAYLG